MSNNYNIWTDIVIPIGSFIGGAILSWWATSKQYKKKIIIQLDVEHKSFKLYNIGNAGVVIKEIGIKQKNQIWYSQSCDKALQVAADPNDKTENDLPF